jgi:hypothetical protein
MRSQYNLSHPGLYDDDAPAEPPRSRVPPGMSLEEYERITRPSSPFPLPREYVEAVQREEGLPVHVREGLQRARLDRLRRGGLP